VYARHLCNNDDKFRMMMMGKEGGEEVDKEKE
jgi:hypothetical protein